VPDAAIIAIPTTAPTAKRKSPAAAQLPPVFAFSEFSFFSQTLDLFSTISCPGSTAALAFQLDKLQPPRRHIGRRRLHDQRDDDRLQRE